MILLFGTMGDIASAAADSLRRAGYEVTHVDFPQNLCRDAAGYRRELVKAIRSIIGHDCYAGNAAKSGFCCVIPIGNALNLARLKPELETMFPEIRVYVESEQKVAMLDSKVACYKFCDGLGIPQPRLLDIDGISDYTKVIFKRDVSFGGHGVHRPQSRESLLNLISHQSPGEPYLIEELIVGDEYSVDVIRKPSGECLSSTYRSIKPSGNSPAQTRESCRRPDLEALAVRILTALEYVGLCGFDFIVDQAGSPYLLEANPRFTGGLSAQIASGFDIPALLVSESF